MIRLRAQINTEFLSTAQFESSHGDGGRSASYTVGGSTQRIEDRQPAAGEFDIVSERRVEGAAREVIAQIEFRITSDQRGAGSVRAVVGAAGQNDLAGSGRTEWT